MRSLTYAMISCVQARLVKLGGTVARIGIALARLAICTMLRRFRMASSALQHFRASLVPSMMRTALGWSTARTLVSRPTPSTVSSPPRRG